MTNTSNDERRLSDLLLRWEERRERGEGVSVEELCADAPGLADELRRRIDALGAMGPMFQSTVPPSDGAGSPSALSALPLPRGGPSIRNSARCSAQFRDLRFHAAGGLGEVFKARGDDLNRDVALKFIKKPRAHDAENRRRFVQEAEITGRLEHPGIVPVYSFGEDEEGHPCYAMRFIAGQTLHDAIGAYHQDAGAGPSEERRRALRGLVRRLVSVCNTIAYAHSRGVLHRDIKPKNIMLGKYEETLVVDWGLARPFDRSDEHRASGEETLAPVSGSSDSPTVGVIGTPGYMSPEQGEGRWEVVGPPSDVFSLGATLYAILTGGPPFTGKDLFEVLKKTESGEFPAPRQVCPDVPPALDAICRKALAPKIEDRYQSALQLADDLDHWLADEPVSAFREPWFVRAQRWGRRHKTSVAALSALVTAAVVALGVIALVSDRQKREIERQKARVVQEYQRAEGNFQNARDVVDRLLTRVGEVELADVPQMERARKTLLDDALEFTLRFQKENAGNPAAVLETARAYGRLGEIREMLGDYSHAEEAYKASLRLLENQPEKSAEVRRARARSAMGLAVLLKKSSRWDEAERAFARAIALREALAPASPEDRHALDDSRYQLGTLYARMPGKRPEAEQAYRDALARPTKSEAPGSEAPTARAAGRARALNNLGMLQAGTGRRAEAEETFREAIGLLEPLKKREPDVVGHRWLLARVYGNLGTLLKDNEARRPEAEELKTKARDLQKTLNDQFPAIPDYAYELAATYANLGLLWATSRPKEAEHAYEAARELIAGLADRFRNRPDYRQRLAITLLNLGLLIEKTDPAEAEHTYEEARAIQEALVKEFPTVPEYRNALGRTLYSRANVLKDAGKLDAARRLFKLAIDAQREALKDNRDSVLYRDSLRDSLGSLAETELERGDHDRAADLAEELPRTVPEGPLECVRAAGILSRCANLAGADKERAEEYARKAVGLLRQALAKGLRDINELDRRSQFDPIRERSDFQEIRKRLADLAKAPLS